MTDVDHAGADLPAGYIRLAGPGVRRAAAVAAHADAVRTVLMSGTLHAWAAGQPGARAMQGRDTAWATPLPDGTPVVVRHSRHGGLLAPLTGDRFMPPTRAPRELEIAVRLAASGVPTPALIAYATYPAGGGLERADVATREVREARDLGAALASGTTFAACWSVVAPLLAALSAAGAHHPDLNVKNILLSEIETTSAWVLDVDRVRFVDRRTAAAENAARLARSLSAWRERHGAVVTDGDLARLRVTGLAHD